MRILLTPLTKATLLLSASACISCQHFTRPQIPADTSNKASLLPVRCEFQIDGELPAPVFEDELDLTFEGELVFEFDPSDYEPLAPWLWRYVLTDASVTLGTDSINLRREFRYSTTANDVNGSTIDVITLWGKGTSEPVQVNGLRYQSGENGPLLDPAMPVEASVYEAFNTASIQLQRYDQDGMEIPGAMGDAWISSITPGQCFPI